MMTMVIRVSLTTSGMPSRPIWSGGIFLPVMENTTDVSTDVIYKYTTCRLRYRCFYSSF